jgi:hypothetical protein
MMPDRRAVAACSMMAFDGLDASRSCAFPTERLRKLIGRDLLVGIVAGENERQRAVYLPDGEWFNYPTNERFAGGQWHQNLPLYVNGEFRLPAFARAGAIIPKMHVDDETMNVTGRRLDTSVRDELITRVYADASPSSFTLYEDDGATTGYQDGAVRTTELSQQLSGSTATVTVGASAGTYPGAASSRDAVVELVVDDTQASAVTLNGSPLTQHASAPPPHPPNSRGRASVRTPIRESLQRLHAEGLVGVHRRLVGPQQLYGCVDRDHASPT